MDDSKKNFSNFHDSYLRQYIQQADTKSSWLFAANSALIIWILGNPQLLSFIKQDSPSFLAVVTVFSALALVTSCGLLFDAIRPRAVFVKEKGIIYFHHVENYSGPDEFANKIIEMDDAAIFRERLRAQYAMSRICATKYRRLYAASLLSVSAFVGVVILHAWLSFVN